MERRTFMAQVFGGILTAPLAAEAQSVGKVWRIGFLGSGSAEGYTDLLQGLRTRLRELGYVEGTIVFEYRFAEDKYDRLPGLAAELAATWTSSWRTHHRRSVPPSRQRASFPSS